MCLTGWKLESGIWNLDFPNYRFLILSFFNVRIWAYSKMVLRGIRIAEVRVRLPVSPQIGYQLSDIGFFRFYILDFKFHFYA